ncbi:MAG: RIP metalloprotease RseP [Puniceicoccales bacterium]|jgi:RIP metalloprotease RseP|nr:RIP metalloprotease RseP [Puniceicoccales bacterium]
MNFDIGNILGGTIGIFIIVLFFGGSIFVHELGHFLAARKRGLKIERFSIGFGPRILGWTGKDGVDYRISLLPLGGYVALPQMADMQGIEGENQTNPDSLPPISYTDKVIVAVMGVVFNVLFAFAIACVLWVTKIPVPANSTTTVIGHIDATLAGQEKPSPARAAGLLPGDKILAIDGEPVEDFTQVIQKINLGSGRDPQGNPQAILTIERNGKRIDPITVKPEKIDLNPTSGDSVRQIGIAAAGDIIIESPLPGTPAAQAGLQQGDQLLALNDTPLHSIRHLRQLLEVNGIQPVNLRLRTATGTERTTTLTPKLHTDTVELARLSFTEPGDGDNAPPLARKLHLVPVPDDYLNPKPNAPRDNLMICDTLPASAAHSGSLRPGTILSAINLPKQILALRTPAELVEAMKTLKPRGNGTVPEAAFFFKTPSEGKTIILRNAGATLVPEKKLPLIGVTHMEKAELVRRNPIEQIHSAFRLTIESLRKLVDRNSDVGLNHLMGVISIAKTYYSNADDIKRILWFTLIININLALLNILPLPVLDGGHILIATVQKILGRALPLKLIATVQYLFITLFLLLMGYVLLNDVKRCSGDNTLELGNKIQKLYVRPPAQP